MLGRWDRRAWDVVRRADQHRSAPPERPGHEERSTNDPFFVQPTRWQCASECKTSRFGQQVLPGFLARPIGAPPDPLAEWLAHVADQRNGIAKGIIRRQAFATPRLYKDRRTARSAQRRLLLLPAATPLGLLATASLHSVHFRQDHTIPAHRTGCGVRAETAMCERASGPPTRTRAAPSITSAPNTQNACERRTVA